MMRMPTRIRTSEVPSYQLNTYPPKLVQMQRCRFLGLLWGKTSSKKKLVLFWVITTLCAVETGSKRQISDIVAFFRLQFLRTFKTTFSPVVIETHILDSCSSRPERAVLTVRFHRIALWSFPYFESSWYRRHKFSAAILRSCAHFKRHWSISVSSPTLQNEYSRLRVPYPVTPERSHKSKMQKRNESLLRFALSQWLSVSDSWSPTVYSTFAEAIKVLLNVPTVATLWAV
jgi:hypothetical protein